MTIFHYVVAVVALLFSIIFHEVAHGYTALRLGDATARDAGRLTLNPFKHIDPFGTVVLPLILILSKFPYPVGWAKPVPVNPYLLRDPKRGMILVGAAGPLANISLILFSALVLRYFPFFMGPYLFDAFRIFCYVNILLTIFNLVPVPPLDGSRVLAGILPQRIREVYVGLGRYGLLIIIGLVLLGLIDKVILPLSGIIFYLLVGG